MAIATRLAKIAARRRSSPAARWRLIVLAAAGVAMVRGRDCIGLPRPGSAAAAVSVPVAIATGVPTGKPRNALVWAAHMWAYKVLFELPYDRPEWLRRRLHIDYVIRCDRMIGAGRPVGQRLQSALRRPPELTKLDYPVSLFYATWEAVPHVALAWILWRHERHFARAAVRLGAVFDATLIGYWLVPTAPPWWASEQAGRMDGEVRRVVIEVKRALRDKPRPVDDHTQGANPWAAMPSDHFASSLMTAMVVSQVDVRLGVAAYAYAALIGASLVYLGEHYVTDLIAGGALAVGVQAAGDSIRRFRS